MNSNTIRTLDFLAKEIEVSVITNVVNYKIVEYTTVINIGTTNAYIDYIPAKFIPPLNSTILKNVNIKSAEALILIKTKFNKKIDKHCFDNIWNLYSDLHPDFPKIPLLISPQLDTYDVELDMYKLLGEQHVTEKKQKFIIKTNFWYAEPDTDCVIHNKHDFMEVHTQIFGSGRMQKFEQNDNATLLEDIIMSPGYTTPIPFCSFSNDKYFNYPWHRYYADTPCIWMAIEYHLKV